MFTVLDTLQCGIMGNSTGQFLLFVRQRKRVNIQEEEESVPWSVQELESFCHIFTSRFPLQVSNTTRCLCKRNSGASLRRPVSPEDLERCPCATRTTKKTKKRVWRGCGSRSGLSVTTRTPPFLFLLILLTTTCSISLFLQTFC